MDYMDRVLFMCMRNVWRYTVDAQHASLVPLPTPGCLFTTSHLWGMSPVSQLNASVV